MLWRHGIICCSREGGGPEPHAPGKRGTTTRTIEEVGMNEVTARTGANPPKIWLASYPPTVPAEIPPLHHHSLGDLFEDSCARYAERPAFSSMGKSLTY